MQFSRPTQAIPLPETMSVMSRYPKRMQENDVYQYNLTLRNGATAENVRALLPEQIPFERQLFDEGNNFLVQVITEGKLEWTLPDLLAHNEPIDAWPKNPGYHCANLFCQRSRPIRSILTVRQTAFRCGPFRRTRPRQSRRRRKCPPRQPQTGNRPLLWRRVPLL